MLASSFTSLQAVTSSNGGDVSVVVFMYSCGAQWSLYGMYKSITGTVPSNDKIL